MRLKIKVFYGADMAGLLNISTENRKMAEDFREKMIINARKNVPLQQVPYFDVQNTDERIENTKPNEREKPKRLTLLSDWTNIQFNSMIL